MKTLILLSLMGFNLFSINSQAQQAAAVSDAYRWEARIEEAKTNDKDEGIPFLVWTKDTIRVETTTLLHYTTIQGRFKEKVTQATLNSKAIPTQEDGSFDIQFGFGRDRQTFNIVAIDSKNKLYRMQYKIVPVEKKEESMVSSSPRRWRFSAGAGVTQLSNRLKNVEPFNQWAVTIKGGATYQLAEKFSLGLSSFYNLVPFGTDSAQGYKLQYLGVNGRVGYNLIGAPSQLRLNLNGGFYYNTALGSNIGFRNMYGPQLYPELIYMLDNGNSILIYGKYSPALSLGQAISLHNNREVAMGVHYSFPITFSNRMSVGFDVSQLSLSIPTAWASTNTYSLSGGISF